MRVPGLYYDKQFLRPEDRKAILAWLQTIYPIWEYRYSTQRPREAEEKQRKLLRPVYWLGNWQFACLDYYRPPKGIQNRCVKAEPFPGVLQKLVNQMEKRARLSFPAKDIPRGWKLNTCLVNFYGNQVQGEKEIDCARVGEHKDFEPGPVASLSLGERAVFQFVESRGRGIPSRVVFQQWLEDGSLQIFAGDRFKKKLFHRVQRVEKKAGHCFALNVEGFKTRRINLTFRFVPDEHIIPYKKLPTYLATDVRQYMEELSRHSPFFKNEIS